MLVSVGIAAFLALQTLKSTAAETVMEIVRTTKINIRGTTTPTVKSAVLLDIAVSLASLPSLASSLKEVVGVGMIGLLSVEFDGGVVSPVPVLGGGGRVVAIGKLEQEPVPI